MRIAIIGTGISGSLAARLLSTQHDVIVFEANAYPGGHANTVDLSLAGSRYPVDTGFMVFNRRTYPNFCRLLQLLEIGSQDSDMSFSVRCSRTGLEYQGSSLNGLFAQRLNCVRPSFLRMLYDIGRFNQFGTSAANGNGLDDGRTVREFLHECGVRERFVRQYLVPMAAAIWSAEPDTILEFPARFMIGFFANHGLMQLRDRPRWRTIIGGSRRYVQALLGPLGDRLRLNCPVAEVARSAQEVGVRLADGNWERFDEVVFACHADQTVKILADATGAEREILTAFPYQPNTAVLHLDARMLPRRKRAWASWNYHIPRGKNAATSVTYDLSRLQQHASPSPILLTLNEHEGIDPNTILRTIHYHHPAYTRASIAAQRRFAEISGRRQTHYCGAYWGYGFHEDGVNSALRVARQFGIGLEACIVASTKAASAISATTR